MKNKIYINLEVSLVEIIFSILIFSIAGAIMLNSFATAKFTQIKANDMVEAGSIIQSNAEIIKSLDNSTEMNEYLSENFELSSSNANENIYIKYFDAKWNLCNEKTKEYIIYVKISDVLIESGEMKKILIKAEKDKPYPFINKNNENKVIYEIETKKFFPTNEGRW